MKIRIFLAIGIAALFGTAMVQGQLIIDRTGARDVLWASSLDQLFPKTNELVRVRFDSSAKSLSLGYFTLDRTEIGSGNILWGVQPKVTATDGWEQFLKFDRMPGLELAGLVNWTGTGANGSSWFDRYVIPYINLRVAYKHQDFETFDPAKPVTDQISKSGFDGVSSYLSTGALIQGRYGVAFSLGYERSSNYEDLKKVQVADETSVIPLPGGGQRVVSTGSKTVRQGNLETFNKFPLDLTFAYHQGIQPRWIEWIPFVPDKYTYGVIFAPYGRYEPRDTGRPEHGIGVTFSLRTLTKLKAPQKSDKPEDPGSFPGGDDVAGQKISFPLSFFVEWKNAFNSDRTVTAGAAAVFKF